MARFLDWDGLEYFWTNKVKPLVKIIQGSVTGSIVQQDGESSSTNNATKAGSVALGSNDTASGSQSFAAGLGNTASGDQSFVTGNGNTATGAQSAIVGGSGNRAVGSPSAVISSTGSRSNGANVAAIASLNASATGENSAVIAGTMTMEQVTVAADANSTTATITFSAASVCPAQVYIGAALCSTEAYSSTAPVIVSVQNRTTNTSIVVTLNTALSTSSVYGATYYLFSRATTNNGGSLAVGSSAASATRAVSVGETNRASAENAVAFGSHNRANGESTIVAGESNLSQGANSAVFGFGNISNANDQLVTGKLNSSDSNSAFIVGGGDTSTFTRGNIHTVKWDGKGWFKDKVSVGSTSSVPEVTANNDLTTKKYVDNKYSDITTDISELSNRIDRQISAAVSAVQALSVYATSVVQEADLELTSDFVAYDTGDSRVPIVRRSGAMVFLEGMVKNTVAFNGDDTLRAVATLPSWAWPKADVSVIQQGSSQYIWWLRVNSADGTIYISRYRIGTTYVNPVAINKQFPLTACWLAKDAAVYTDEIESATEVITDLVQSVSLSHSYSNGVLTLGVQYGS